VFGFTDWLAIPAGTRAKRIGLIHGGTNVLVVATFALVWWLRSEIPGNAPTTSIMLIEVLALVMGAICGLAGW
jgi:hypothetical protein